MQGCKKIIQFLTVRGFFTVCFGQVNFSKIPQKLQLYARDLKTDSARVYHAFQKGKDDMTIVQKMLTTAVLAMALTGICLASDYDPSLFEGVYPGTSSSRSAFNFNGRSFFVNGKPVYLYIGEMHYARVPRELWRDRIMKMKRAGYNTVQSYVFWNAHEPIHGQFHYEGNLDLDAWLSLCDSLGMYSILRLGPYDCAEWDAGGYAPWLAGISGMKYRSLDGPFFSYVKSYWQNLFPKLLNHQIHKNGKLIMVQIENEIMVADKPYHDSLCNYAKSLGLEIPYIYSQVFNGGEPSASLVKPYGWFSTPPNPPAGPFPWITTEFWMGWFNLKGEPSADQLANCIIGSWRWVASGTGGLSHYMIHGGTNFGYTASDDNQFTSYDYHAPIAEEGHFHQNYWVVREVGMLTRTFEPVLAISTNGSSMASLSPAGGNQSLYVHTTPSSGTIGIVENWGTTAATLKLTWNGKGITVPTTGAGWRVEPAKWCYFVADVPVTSNAKIDYSVTGILSIKQLGSRIYLVLHGPAGASGEIAFAYTNAPSPAPSSPWAWNTAAKRASLTFTYPSNDSVYETTVSDGAGRTLNCLIMNSTQAITKTWVDDRYIASGPAYVDESNNMLFPATGGRAFVYNDTGRSVVTKAATTAPSPVSFASGWKWTSAAPEIAATYDDTKWQTRTGLQDMASFGWPNGYGWYRASYTASAAGNATFSASSVQDSICLFLNGVNVGGSGGEGPANFTIPLKQGVNTLAMFVADYSRFKEYNYYGAPRDIDMSGLINGAAINGTPLTPLKFRGGFDGIVESPLTGNISDSSWNLLMARNTWSGVPPASSATPAFWRMDFTYMPPASALQTWDLAAPVGRASRGVVWLNGHNIGRLIEGQWPLFIPQSWLKSGNNTFLVMTENGAQPTNWQLTPIQYLAYGGQASTKAIPPGHKPAAEAQSHCSEFKVNGSVFVIPRQFAGKKLSVRMYDLSGKLICQTVTRSPMIKLSKEAGVRIVHLRTLD